MRFHKKLAFPKEYYPNNEEFVKYIHDELIHGLVEALEPYATYEENETMALPELADKNGWTKEYWCSIDISIPAKLTTVGGCPGYYICSNCKEIRFKFELRPHPIYAGNISRYCPDCGAHFTNLTRDEFGSLRVKEEES